MKRFLTLLNIAALGACLLLGSCASYVNALHNQISQEQQGKRGQMAARQQGYSPGAYRQRRYSREGDRRPIENPKTLGGYPSTSNRKNVYPKTRRDYGSRRVKADDLKDNGDDGSLWSGKSAENFLFVTNNIKKPGDIVIVEVLSKMKNDITAELKRVYPEPKKSKKDEDGEKDGGGEDQADQTAQAPQSQDDKKVHDKISTQVIEAVNKDYLLVRGRKEVFFRKAKRFIELQALVSRRDITDNDTVASDKVLEPRIRVLRY